MSAGGDNGGGVTQYNVTQYNAIPADIALAAAQPSPGQPSPAQPSPGREAAPVSPCAAATRGSHFYTEPSPASGSQWPTHTVVYNMVTLPVLFRYIN